MNLVETLTFVWKAGTMVPLNLKAAERHFREGQSYRMDVREERTDASHRHYFASINEAFNNLPEKLAEEIPSAEHLRKWALIRAGYCEHRTAVFATPKDAIAAAALAKPMDDYAVVSVRDCTVNVFTAKSQSRQAMGGKVFGDSKKAVLGIISGLLGIDAGKLKDNTARAA